MKTVLKYAFTGMVSLVSISSFGIDMYMTDLDESVIKKEEPVYLNSTDVNGSGSEDTILYYRSAEILTFTASVENNQISMRWVSEIEIDNSHYTIERSLNINEWETIGTVSGAGNSNSILSYSYTDKNPFNGISYYRLKNTDHHGNDYYSRVEAVETSQEKPKWQIYPQPTNDCIRIIPADFSEASIELSVISSNGLSVMEKVWYTPGNSLDISGLSAGLYFILLKTDKKTETIKLLKN